MLGQKQKTRPDNILLRKLINDPHSAYTECKIEKSNPVKHTKKEGRKHLRMLTKLFTVKTKQKRKVKNNWDSRKRSPKTRSRARILGQANQRKTAAKEGKRPEGSGRETRTK